MFVLGGKIALGPKVKTCTKGASIALQQNDTHFRIAVRSYDRVGELLSHGRYDRVHDVGAVEGDGRDAIRGFIEYESARHDAPMLGMQDEVIRLIRKREYKASNSSGSIEYNLRSCGADDWVLTDLGSWQTGISPMKGEGDV